MLDESLTLAVGVYIGYSLKLWGPEGDLLHAGAVPFSKYS